ncbi:MAG: DUF11 domain-containing protein [Verrucomicrobiota bacterium]
MKLSLTTLRTLLLPGALCAGLLLTGCETHTESGPGEPHGAHSNVHGYSAADSESSSSTAPAGSLIYEDDLVMVSKEYLSGSTLGAPLTYKINVQAKQSVTNVEIDEMLPSELKFQQADPKASMDQFGMPSWDLPAMKAGDTESITVTVIPSSVGNFEVCSVVRADPMICLPVFVGQPELTIAKTGPATAEIGQDVTWEVVTTNVGNAAATDVVITDTLPPTFTAKSPLSKDVGTLAPGDSATMTVVASSTTQGSYINTATTNFAEGVPIKATSPIVIQQTSLKIVKSGPASGYIFVDEPYTVTVTNDGDTTLNNIVVVDNLPDDFVLEGEVQQAEVKDVDSGETIRIKRDAGPRDVFGYWRPGGNPKTDDSADQITWNIDTLAPGASRTFNLAGYATRPMSTTNSATASVGDISETDTAVTQWRAVPGVHTSIADNIDPIQVGQETTYTIKTLNQSSYETFTVTSQSVSIPTSLKIVSVSTGGVISGQMVSFPAVSLAPGREVTRSITVEGASGETATTKMETMTNFRDTPVIDQESTTIY